MILKMKLSKKQKAFLTYNTKVECCEGQTYGGKTTIGAIKFILRVKASKKKLHCICGLDLGTIEKNIINSEMGILAFYGDEVDYRGNGDVEFNLPHLYVESPHGRKVVFLFGYADQARWKKALGGQYGCGMIDEVNTADMDLVREVAMRCDYLLMTLNPDDPNLPIYREYINHCRPLPNFEKDVPSEMMNQLLSQPAKDGWVHWYFRMDDNPTLTPEKKASIIANVPEGSKTWKAKILGLRGRSEGLVYDEFTDKKIIKLEQFKWLPMEMVSKVICGLDSGLNNDATALVTSLITTAGRLLVIPSFYYLPKIGSNANSQQAINIAKWLDYWLPKFGINITNMVSIIGDSAAITQDLMYEINLKTPFRAMKVDKKDILKDTQRVKSIIGKEDWFYIIDAGYRNPLNPNEVLGHNDMFIVELNNQIWDLKKNQPMDGNDHCIDAFKYASSYIYQMFRGGI